MGAIHSCCLCARTEERRRTAPRPARLPNDVVQNVVEYLDTVQDVMESRRVAVDWRTAVAYAIGFLNGRCWDQLVYVEGNSHWRFHRHFRAESPPTNICACTIVSLGAMLKVLHCEWPVDVDPNVIFQACPELVDVALEPITATYRTLRRTQYNLWLLELDVRPCPKLRSLRVPSWLRRQHAILITGRRSCLADVRLSSMTLYTWIFSTLPALTTLDLGYCRGCAELTLHGSANLRHLRLCYSDITQEVFATLALKTLRWLSVFGCTQVTDIGEIWRCRSLTYLALGYSGVANVGLDFISLPSLARLDLSGLSPNWAALAPKLRDGCSDLQWLNLYESNADDNFVSVMGAMRALSELNLCGCRRVTTATALANALSLTRLCLSRTRVSSTGIIGLHTLPLLATLLLDGTWVDDIGCLQSCPALTWLDISKTRVRDVTPLAQIATLRVLTAARTMVADFTPVMRKHLTLRLD
jgi:hypothetical protein